MSTEQLDLVITELLEQIGIAISPDLSPAHQIGLVIDHCYSLHFEIIDPHSWLMLTDLGYCAIDDPAFYRLGLLQNEITPDCWQPTVCMNEERHLVCWVRLPLPAPELPVLLRITDKLLALTEMLLAAAPEKTFSASAPS